MVITIKAKMTISSSTVCIFILAIQIIFAVILSPKFISPLGHISACVGKSMRYKHLHVIKWTSNGTAAAYQKVISPSERQFSIVTRHVGKLHAYSNL